MSVCVCVCVCVYVSQRMSVAVPRSRCKNSQLGAHEIRITKTNKNL
jgi:hypothetical protein